MEKDDLILEKLANIERRLDILLSRVESNESRNERMNAIVQMLMPIAASWLSATMGRQGAYRWEKAASETADGAATSDE